MKEMIQRILLNFILTVVMMIRVRHLMQRIKIMRRLRIYLEMK